MRLNLYKRIGNTPKWIINFFTERILSNHGSRLLANMWDQVYLIIGPFFTYWKGILITCLQLCVYLSLIPLLQPSSEMFLFVLRLALFIFVGLFFSIPFSPGGCRRYNLFIIIGRREYFWRGIVALSIIILMALGCMTVFILLFNLLTQNIIPSVWGSKSSIILFEWTLLIAPIITIPLFGGLVILFKKTRLIISIVIIFCIAVAISYTSFMVMESTPLIIDLLIILSAIAISWGFHIAVLYYDSMKRSLC